MSVLRGKPDAAAAGRRAGSSRASRGSRAGRAGLTLIELVLAVGLASLLMVALVALLDTSLNLFERTETRRDLSAASAALAELLARDLSTLEAGPRGDLVADWIVLDTDGDGVAHRPLQRLRLVRRPAPGELARLQAGRAEPVPDLGLLEVAWALLPPRGAEDPEDAAEGVLWRGERIVGDAEVASFFDPRFFDAAGRPAPGTLVEVTGGVLWMEVLFATATSVVRSDAGAWRRGDGLADVTASWDAWGRARPDPRTSAWNEPGAGVPAAGERPVLPRRARIAFELERPRDRLRRTELADELGEKDAALVVRSAERLPDPGTFLLIDEEWMELRSVDGRRASVRRGARGTPARPHERGATVHHGHRVVRELPIAVGREEWTP